MSGEYGTPYLESELILSWQNDDFTNANRLARELLDGEREKLVDQLRGLADYLEDWKP